jgi:hypothetical protein
MAAISLILLLFIVVWMWLKKPNFPAKLFFNDKPISYLDSRKKWLLIYSLCIILLLIAGGFKFAINWIMGI